MKRPLDVVAPLVLVIVIVGGWEAACRLLKVPAYFVPPPSAVALVLVRQAPSLLASAWNTLSMALQALFMAALFALPLALLAGVSRSFAKAVHPLAVTLQVTPVVAVAPLVVIWAGLDHPQRAIVALAAVVAFFPLFSGALTGLRSCDPDLRRLFALYGSSRVQVLFRLRLPSAIPFMLEGLKVASGLAVIGAVVAEFVAGSGGAQGLAWRILEAGQRLRTADMFAAVLVLGVLGAGLNAVIGALEKLLLARWLGRPLAGD
jgi:NitT/TauT family transport system permease protein